MVDIGIMKDMEELVLSQSDFEIKCKDDAYLIEPYGKEIEVWKDGEKIGRYSSLFEFIKTFRVNGILLVECLDSVELVV